MTDKKTFGSFIRIKRTEKNLSQKDMAEMLFVTEGAVSKWERGISYPDITLIADICRVLEISEHELITASTDMDTRKMKQEARKFRAIRDAWFWVPTALYGIALIICFICNLALNRTLSWFFVVLASLLCAFTFVPTVTGFFQTGKLLAFCVSTYLSVCLLLLTCAVYTNSISWLLTACIGVLMGYVLVFGPKLLSNTEYSHYKYVIVFTFTFALTVLMMLHIRLWQPFPLGRAILMAAYGFAPAVVSACVCAFYLDAFLKAGICTSIIAVAFYFANHVITWLFGPSDNHYRVDFHDWEQCMNGNFHLIFLISLLLIGVLLAGIGVSRTCKGRER